MDDTQANKGINLIPNKRLATSQFSQQKTLNVKESKAAKKNGIERTQGKLKKRNKKRKSKLIKQMNMKGEKGNKGRINSMKKGRELKDRFDLKKKLINNGTNGGGSIPNKLLGNANKSMKGFGNPFKGDGLLSSEERQNLGGLINKRGLSSLICTHDAFFDKPSPFVTHPLGVIQRTVSDTLLSQPNNTLLRMQEFSQKADGSYLIKRQDKFEREKQLLLILDDMLEQIKQFTLDNKIVDFVKISENLAHHNLSPKICIRLWDSLKKKLKDFQKRENEFQLLCRNEVNVDFWTETIKMFKLRIKTYEKTLHPKIDITSCDLEKMNTQKLPDLIETFQREEERVQTMMNTYFQLFNEPNSFVNVMDSLNQQVNSLSITDMTMIDTTNQTAQTFSSIDKLLSELLAEINFFEQEREMEILKNEKQSIKSDFQSINEVEWTQDEITSLIKGVLRFGENEWSELIDDIEVSPSKTPNMVALKWRQIKRLMKEDIQRAAQMINGEKIITKHEWMMASIQLLEKEKRSIDDSPQKMYDTLFIDPSKLTPYQQQQLEQQRQQLIQQDQNQRKLKQNKLQTLNLSNRGPFSGIQNNINTQQDIEQNKEELKTQSEQQVTKGVIDLKEYAPHLLEQSKSQSRTWGDQSKGSGIQNEAEVVKIIQQFYQQQCSQDPSKIFNQNFYSQIGIQKPTYNNFIIPPQNQIVPKDALMDQFSGEKAQRYSQVLNRRKEQLSSLHPQPSSNSEFQKPQQKQIEGIALRQLLLQNNIQRQQQLRGVTVQGDQTTSEQTCENMVIKPATLKYVTPPHLQRDHSSSAQPLTFQNNSSDNSPKLDKKGSFASEKSCFSKPTVNHTRQIQHSNMGCQFNFYINQNISVNNFQNYYSNPSTPTTTIPLNQPHTFSSTTQNSTINMQQKIQQPSGNSINKNASNNGKEQQTDKK